MKLEEIENAFLAKQILSGIKFPFEVYQSQKLLLQKLNSIKFNFAAATIYQAAILYFWFNIVIMKL